MTDRDPPVIDHNPHERRFTNGIWWTAWIMLALVWVGSLYLGNIRWDDVCLGIGTGGILLGWAVDITGNKVPESWTRKKPRR